MMTGMNRVGAVYCAANRAMTHEILRDEWGFRGSVVTDSYGGTSVDPLWADVVGGVDLMLGNCTETVNMDDPTIHAEMRESAKNIIYAWCNAYATAKTHDPSEDRFTANVDTIVVVEKPTPYWSYALYALDAVYVATLAILIFKRKLF